MSNFNANKCYVEKFNDNSNNSNWIKITYYFQIISSFIYTAVVISIFCIIIFYRIKYPYGHYPRLRRRRHSLLWDCFILYVFGWPNLKIFLNSIFAPKIKLDFANGLISINNKPLSIERAEKISIVEIRPYHQTWRFGVYPAFNLSGYKKSIVTITTSFGDISFYVCSEKALELLTKFFEKYNKDYTNTYDERMLWFTFY